eukprot:Seg11109.1 transcript_id=Seg11109.1/GoldUCD/mRNA.D3Y31 product="hypothetical protein" protein_id=Seg11109.1/GoldUCD/D3Y31
MKKMSEKISHEECGSQSCYWPCYHRDLQKLDDTGEYMGIPIADQHAGERPNITRSSGRKHSFNVQEKVRDKSAEQITSLISRLESDLRKKVFSDSAKELIEDTRLLTDLKMLAIRVQSRGAILISNLERVKYLTTVRKIIPSVKDVPDDAIIPQFRKFLERLEQEVKNKKEDDLDSKELIKLFLKKERAVQRN